MTIPWADERPNSALGHVGANYGILLDSIDIGCELWHTSLP